MNFMSRKLTSKELLRLIFCCSEGVYFLTRVERFARAWASGWNFRTEVTCGTCPSGTELPVAPKGKHRLEQMLCLRQEEPADAQATPGANPVLVNSASRGSE